MAKWIEIGRKRELTKCLQFLKFSVFEQTVKNALCKIILLFWTRRIRRSLGCIHIHRSALCFARGLLLSIRDSSFRLSAAGLTKLLLNRRRIPFTSPLFLLCCSSIWLTAHFRIWFQCSVLIHFSSICYEPFLATHGLQQSQLRYP